MNQQNKNRLIYLIERLKEKETDRKEKIQRTDTDKKVE